MRRFLYLAAMAAFLATPARADLEAGLALFERGDFELAENELKPLAEQGDPRARYALGIIYLNGFVDPPDPSSAAALMREAASQGYVQAQTELARMYRTGDGVAQDYAEMAYWYAKAAEQGDVGAQLFLADSYAYGYGVERDYVQAYMWYEIAIQYWGPLAVRARQVIAEKMTPEDIAEAVRRSGRWLQENSNR